MRKSNIVLSVLLCCIAVPSFPELTHSLIINEVMQSVTKGSVDQLNEYPDGWIELYNPSNQSVTLTGYAIGEKYKFSKSYQIGKATQKSYDWWTQTEVWNQTSNDIKIPAKGYIVIYCDNEAVTCGSEVHTDFRMPNAKGGTIYLFDKNKNLVDSLYLPPMPATDVSYGRETDGTGKFGYMLTPTKSAKNSGGLAKMVLPEPVMTNSHVYEAKAGGEAKANVVMSLPAGVPSDAVIRYTTDGSEPTSSSNKYTTGSMLSFGQNTVVKAAIFASGCVTPPATTRCYIFLGHKMSVPIVSMVTDRKNLYDSKIGIITNNTSDNNSHDWRRPVKMDYFPAGQSTPLFNQGAEIRVSGAYSRSNAQKSFIAYSDSRFGSGAKDYFEAQFWPETNPDMKQSPSIGLRCSGNDFNFSQMRDGVAQMLFGMNTELDWQGFQPAIAFFNGEYYGILNIRERANEDNVWMHHTDSEGKHQEDITLLENPSWGSGLKKGDQAQYNDYSSFLDKKSTNFRDYQDRIDIEEYTNFVIANIYMSNTDFPGNNYVLWRPILNGGKWRYILKDVDRSFGFCYWHGDSSNRDGGRSDAKYLRWILRNPANVFSNNYEANSDQSTRLIRNLMRMAEYRNLFIDRFTVYLGDFLTAENIASVIDNTADAMSIEMEYHKKLYGGTVREWYQELDNMKKWAAERTESMYAQLKEYPTFQLGTPVPSTINKAGGSYKINVNDIPLATGMFDGKLFAGRKYTVKAARANGDSRDLGWLLAVYDSRGGIIDSRVIASPTMEYTPVSSAANIVISVLDGVSGIDGNRFNAEPVSVEYINMQGMESAAPFQGMNIIRYTYPDGTVTTEKLLVE